MTTKLIPDPPPCPTNTLETQLIQVCDLLHRASTTLQTHGSNPQCSSNDPSGFLIDLARRAVHQVLDQRPLAT